MQSSKLETGRIRFQQMVPKLVETGERKRWGNQMAINASKCALLNC